LYDRKTPFYVAPRIGKNGKAFKMIKLRTMIIDANSYPITVSADDDPRITQVGKWIRYFKVDEFAQILNVLNRSMNLVGPRPQIPQEVNNYADVEKQMLFVKPGITDIASLVFADQGKILEGAIDKYLLYAQIERPWKSRLGLLYVQHVSLWLDLRLIFYTFTNMFARSWTLKRLSKIVAKWPTDTPDLKLIVARTKAPYAYPVPGAKEIIQQL
jgi:lipopolysaccharide/colanic/teichoic acid biosynthesis glycosyltransferase